MKINLAKSAGFCFGVKRAIQMALNLAQSGALIEMLGDIVHNDAVVKQIKAAGIKKISALKRSGAGKILLVRAHGAARATIEKACTLGYSIIDATCPMVKEIHTIAKEMENTGYHVIIIGDKSHDEVRGIAGQLTHKATIIDSPDTIPLKRIPKNKKCAIIVQSTQNIENVQKIVDILACHIKNLKFVNTICTPTKTKQQEIRSMPSHNDVMIIIGSHSSANTKRLWEISKSLNSRSYWIETKLNVKPEWFKDASSVGVTSGASTPDVITHEVISHIKRVTASN